MTEAQVLTAIDNLMYDSFDQRISAGDMNTLMKQMFQNAQNNVLGGTFTPSNVVVDNTDSLRSALAKLQGQITAQEAYNGNAFLFVDGSAPMQGQLDLVEADSAMASLRFKTAFNTPSIGSMSGGGHMWYKDNLFYGYNANSVDSSIFELTNVKRVSSNSLMQMDNLNNVFVYVGASPVTWKTPALLKNKRILVINRSASSLTIQSFAGANDLFDLTAGSASSSVNSAANTMYWLICDGTNWISKSI